MTKNITKKELKIKHIYTRDELTMKKLFSKLREKCIYSTYICNLFLDGI